jgi:hypothetical protein
MFDGTKIILPTIRILLDTKKKKKKKEKKKA